MGVALVTNAGGRLGRAMALYLAGRGFDVAVHYVNAEKSAFQVVAEIEALDRRAVAFQADLLDETAATHLLPRSVQELGPVTCLVNNASIFEHDTPQSATRTSWNLHMDGTLRAAFVLSQAMAAQGLRVAPDPTGEPLAAGMIVNIIDQRVHTPAPEFMTHTLANGGLWALTQTSAQALAPHLRVNAISPDPTLHDAAESMPSIKAQKVRGARDRVENEEDATAALGYFLDAPGVTGKLVCLNGGNDQE